MYNINIAKIPIFRAIIVVLCSLSLLAPQTLMTVYAQGVMSGDTPTAKQQEVVDGEDVDGEATDGEEIDEQSNVEVRDESQSEDSDVEGEISADSEDSDTEESAEESSDDEVVPEPLGGSISFVSPPVQQEPKPSTPSEVLFPEAIFSTTLNPTVLVSEDDGMYGHSLPSHSALTDSDFTYEGVEYTVDDFYFANDNSSIYFHLSNTDGDVDERDVFAGYSLFIVNDGETFSSEITKFINTNNGLVRKALANVEVSDPFVNIGVWGGWIQQSITEVEMYIAPDTTPPTLSRPSRIGTTSNSTPVFSFNSDEEGEISFSGSCSSTTETATMGENTVIFNKLTDGTYTDCSLTVTDSAGNVSQSLSVPAFTIDPTVPIFTATFNPTVLINEDDAIYGHEIPGNNALTDSDFTYDGVDYTIDSFYFANASEDIYFRLSNTGGDVDERDVFAGYSLFIVNDGETFSSEISKFSDSDDGLVRKALANVEVSNPFVSVGVWGGWIQQSITEVEMYIAPDTTAPTLSRPSRIGTTSDETPDFSFTTDEDGEITLSGSCSSQTTTATMGENTITFNTLIIGRYADCTITVTDSVGNESQQLAIPTFTVNPRVIAIDKDNGEQEPESRTAIEETTEETTDDAIFTNVLFSANFAAGNVISPPTEGGVYGHQIPGHNALTNDGGDAHNTFTHSGTLYTVSGLNTEQSATVYFRLHSGPTGSSGVDELRVFADYSLAVVDNEGNAFTEKITSFKNSANGGHVSKAIGSSPGISWNTFSENNTTVTFYIIQTPPTLSNPSSIGTTNNNTPDLSFTSNEDGTFALTGECSSSTASDVTAGTEKTITLNVLPDGEYSDCAITVTNSDGSRSLPLSIPTFTIDTTAPVITVQPEAKPEFATTQEYTLPTATVTDPGNSDYNGVLTTLITNSGGTTVAEADVTDVIGTYTVTYSATADSVGNTPENVVRTISVVSPTKDDTATTTEDTPVEIDVLVNDIELSGGTLTIETNPTNGIASVSRNNQITYTPGTNYHGSDSFTYTYTIEKESYTATVNLTITPVNDAPALIGSPSTSYTINAPQDIDVSTHFTDIDGDTLTFSVTSADETIAQASITLSTLTITPVSDGSTTLTLTVGDGTTTITQEYSITVNLPLTASSDLTPATPSQTKTLTLTFSHSPTITYKRIESDATGTCDETGYASISGTEETYTTALSFEHENDNGDSICFKLTQTGKDAIYHTQVINGIDTTAPTLSSTSDIGTTDDETPEFSFTSNEDGTFTLTGSCASGTATDVSADTEKTIILDTLIDGEYSDCVVTVTDGAGNVSSQLQIPTFTIDTTEQITPNSFPTISGETLRVVIEFSGEVTEGFNFRVIYEHPDFEHTGEVGTYGDLINPTEGSTNIGPNLPLGRVRYSLNAASTKSLSFNRTGDVSISDWVDSTIRSQKSLYVGTSPDNLMTVSLQEAHTGGGFLTFFITNTPLANFLDGIIANTQSQRIFFAIGDRPISAIDDTVVVKKNTPLEIDVLDNDYTTSDTTLALGDDPANGSIALSSSNTKITYTPNTDYVGSDSFTYTITKSGFEREATVSVTVKEDEAPTAPTVTDTIDEDAAETEIDIAITDDFTEKADLTLAITQAPTKGTATLEYNSSAEKFTLSYTPNEDEHGTDTFTYTVTDSASNVATGTITLTITAVNDAPTVISSPSNPPALASGASASTFDISTHFTDVDDTSLTFTITTDPTSTIATTTISGSEITITPVSEGSTTFTITATDTDSLFVTHTYTITVSDKPTVTIGAETSNDHPQYAKEGDTITLIIDPSEDLQNTPTATIAGTTATVVADAERSDIYTDTAFDLTSTLQGETDTYGYHHTKSATALTDTEVDINGHTYDILELSFNNEDNTITLEIARDDVAVNPLNVLTGVRLTITDNNTPTNTITININDFSLVSGTNAITYDAGERDTTSTNPLLHDWSTGTGTLTLSLSRSPVYLASATITSTQTEGAVSYSVGSIVDTDGVAGDNVSGTLTITIDTTAPDAPSVPDLVGADDTGTSDTDNITEQTEDLTFTVTGEDGGSVQLFEEEINSEQFDINDRILITFVKTTLTSGEHSLNVYGFSTTSYGTHFDESLSANIGSLNTPDLKLTLRSGDYTLEAFFCEETSGPDSSSAPDIRSCTIAIKDEFGNHQNIFEVAPGVQIGLQGAFRANVDDSIIFDVDSIEPTPTPSDFDGAYHFYTPSFTDAIANELKVKNDDPIGFLVLLNIIEPEIPLGKPATISGSSTTIDLDLEPREYSLIARLTDQAGNSVDSPSLRVVVEESADLTATITPAGESNSKTMNLEITGRPSRVNYKQIDKTETSAECSAGGYAGITASEETIPRSTTSILFNSEEDNGDSVCFKLTKTSGVKYVRSSVIEGIDATAPTLSSTSDIGTTRDTTPDFSFTSNEDGTFALSGACSTTTATSVSADTQKTITFSTLTDGDYSDCAITVTDGVGNVSSSLQIPTFTIDSTPPSAPTNLDLSSADDTGVSDTDNITTKTRNLVFSVDADNGSIIEILENSNVVKDEHTFTLTVGANTETPQTHWFSDGAYGSLNTQTITLNGENYTITELSLTDKTITLNISDGTDIIDPSELLSGYFLEVKVGSDIIRVPFADFSFNSTDSVYTTTLSTTPSNAFTQTDASLNITIRNGLGVVSDGSATLSIHLGVGEHTLTAVATDEVGNRSAPSTSLTVSVVSEISLTDDTATTTEDTFVEIDVLDNDIGATGGTLSISRQPTNATAELSSSNTKITYTPNANYSGTESFGYRYTKDSHTYDATVVVTTTTVNDTPTAGDTSVSTNEDTEITITPTITDIEDRTPDITSIANVDVALGTASITADKEGIIYTPAENANGVDTFTYTVTDAGGATAIGTITLTIVAVNDIPTTNNPQNPPSIPLDSDPQTFDISTHFIDVEDSTLDLAITTASDSTIATVTISGGVLTITPVSQGETSVVITASDDDSASIKHSYKITISQAANTIPVAPNVAESTPEDTEITITPAITDVEDTTPDITSISNVDATLGSAVITTDKEGIIYTPAENANGIDTFSYTVTDSAGATATGTITLTIDAVNDAPVLSSAATTTHTITATTDIDISTHFTDVEGDTLTFSVSNSDSTKATVSITGTTLTITPLSDGAITLTVTVNDGTTSITQEYSITVNLPITVSSEITPTGISKTKTLTLTFSHTPTITYKVIESDATGTCDETGYNANTGTEGTYTTALLFNHEGYNGDRICFKLTQTGKDTIYHAQTINDIDSTAPTYSEISLTSDNDPNTHARTGSILTLTFTASESLKTTPTVTIAGQTATLRSPTTNADGTVTYSASYTVTSTDTQGEVDYTISAPTDTLGNVGVQTTATDTIIIDTERPVIALTGGIEIELTTEEEYTEEGVEVTDNDVSYDEDATTTIIDENGDTVAPEDVTDNIGVYTVRYSAPRDSAGNTPFDVIRTVTVIEAFNLDFDGNDTFTPSQDALALYLVTQLRISSSILSSYVYDKSTQTASNTITLINDLVDDTTNTPLDFDGNDTFTPSQDALALYLVTQLRISASILSSYVYDRSTVTASTTIGFIDDLVERTNP